MYILKKYGVASTLIFPLITAGAQDFEATPATFAAGDVQISKDEGAFANSTNLPSHVGNGIYSLALTATEMQAATISVVVIDQTATKVWEDQSLVIDTYGNVSAEHGFDLDTATQDVNVTQLGGVAQSATDLKAFADAGYDPATNKIQGVVLVDTVTDLTNLPATAALEATSQDILTDTGMTIPSLIAALNDLSSGEAQDACNAALVALALDHLLQVAHPTGIPTPGTIFDLIMSKDANQNYTRTLHSLQALQGQIPTSSAEVIVTPLSGSTIGSILHHREVIEIVRGDVGYVVYYQLNLGPGGTISGFEIKFGAKEKTTDQIYALGPITITGDVISLETDENSNVIVTGKISIPDTSSLTPGRRYIGEINMVNSSTNQELTVMQFYLNVVDDVIK